MSRRHRNRSDHVAVEGGHVVHDRHGPAAQDIRWTDDEREANFLGHVARLFSRHRGAARRLRNAQIPQQLRETLSIFGKIDRIG